MLGAFALLWPFAPLGAEGSPYSEYQIKAAFLFNFAKFVEWPERSAQSEAEFVVAILGEDPFGKELEEELEKKTIQDRKLVIKRVATVQEAAGAQLLFVSASERHALAAILAAVKDLPILTVSDIKDFAQHGGMLGFSADEKKVRFHVNARAAEQAGLKISSQLLKLAKTVISQAFKHPTYA